MKKLLSLAVLAATMMGASVAAQAVDLSAAVGATGQGDMTLRLGAGFNWDKSWWESSTGHLTGYWDTGVTYWGAGDRAGARYSLSVAPVFVYEFNGDSVKPFIEAGIGLAGFTGAEVGDRDLGSAFAFEDRLGFGVKFADGQKVGVRAIHYSNAGLNQPNDGIESYSLFYSLPL
ncbi:acyloxyacyl hydrolase [Pseudomonas citronellolis]|uniref:acyloxyacyl hydrolase n=1 Tax=Pseudomonas citronellolis TaxID=53408 RepID=UPI0023E3CD58|nr:acyloxyacyl hydrolase [Pseudomonas citronellolis]MDF3933289.1 acyloxyacyl hydrolase [Pseudomonas citronellolis]